MTKERSPGESFVLEVWGDYGCFTRPELKVERFSYPCMTPSAARNIFDSIYLEFDKDTKKPAHRWEITRIEILEPIRYVALMRNEVKDKISAASVKKWMKNPADLTPIYADGTKDELGTDAKGRTQRQTMALKCPRYRIHGHAVLFREDYELRQKIERSFKRRAQKGQCIYQPYLGCREFAASFELVSNATEPPTDHTEDIGWMLYDVFDLSRAGTNTDRPRISLFEAKIENGVLNIPSYDSPQVIKPEVV